MPESFERQTLQKAREDDPERLPDRTRRDSVLEIDIQRVWEENLEVFGVRKVWRQLNRESIKVALCTVGRLMKRLEYKALHGVASVGQLLVTIPWLQRLTVFIKRK